MLWNRSDLLRLRFRFQFLLWKSFGSSFGFGLFPVPDPDLQYLAQFYEKYVQNLAFLVIEAVMFPRNFVSYFDFGLLYLNLMLDRV